MRPINIYMSLPPVQSLSRLTRLKKNKPLLGAAGQCGQVTLGCSPGPRGSRKRSCLCAPLRARAPFLPVPLLAASRCSARSIPRAVEPVSPRLQPAACARACKLRGRGHTLSHTRACAHILARAVRLRASSARASRHVRAALPTPPR